MYIKIINYKIHRRTGWYRDVSHCPGAVLTSTLYTRDQSPPGRHTGRSRYHRSTTLTTLHYTVCLQFNSV